MNNEKFWLEDPASLLLNFRVFPCDEMSRDQKLNSLTRLSLLIAFILYQMKYQYALSFLAIALFTLILLKYSNNDLNNDNDIEGFTMVPTYASNDFHTTTVAPLFAEEWHIPPPAYDIYTNVPPAGDSEPLPELIPQEYPYGQYITKTNLLPSDEYYTHHGCGSPRSAREFVNSSFLRHRIANADNLTRIYKKKLNRRFRHNSNDTFSPFTSY